MHSGAKILTGAQGTVGVTCGDSASVQTPLMLAGCVDAGSRGWVLEWQEVTQNDKSLGCSGSASSSLKRPSSHPSQEASGAVWLSTRTPSGRLAVGSGVGGCFLRSSSSLFLLRSFSCSSSCQKIPRSEHRRSHLRGPGRGGKLRCLSSTMMRQNGKCDSKRRWGVRSNGGDGVSAPPRGTADSWRCSDNTALCSHIWEMRAQWEENCFLQAGEGAGLGQRDGAFLRLWPSPQ